MSSIGQHVFIGISGKSLTSDEKKFIIQNDIGGVCLFGRNYESLPQIHALCTELLSLRHQTKSKVPLLIGIDMEGGRVHRLKAPFTQWPAQQLLGKIDSPTVSYNFSVAMGAELKAVGINLDFSPCLDVLTNPKNTVIGDRALSSDTEVVAKHGSAIIRGFIKSGVIPCPKHFPGHGDTLIDSHLDLPVETANLERLEKVELVPFKKAIRSRLDLIMTSHILFKNVDPDWPVTLSEVFLQKILKKQLGFRGLIISDDLGMKALAARYPAEQIPVRAMQVGVDYLLYCNEPETPPLALEALYKALAEGLIRPETNKLLELKKKYLSSPDPLPLKVAETVVGHPEHIQLAEAIRSGVVPSGLIRSHDS